MRSALAGLQCFVSAVFIPARGKSCLLFSPLTIDETRRSGNTGLTAGDFPDLEYFFPAPDLRRGWVIVTLTVLSMIR